MGLIRSIAFRYRDLGLPAEDLAQEGAIGLLTAIDEYDSSRGVSFSTYACWRICAAITHAATAHGQLHAIADALHEFPADEILLVTAPQRPSRWLRPNVIDRARQAFREPITHVVMPARSERRAP
jgi:RNA polymerase sigma factor (sigma-70 family)